MMEHLRAKTPLEQWAQTVVADTDFLEIFYEMADRFDCQSIYPHVFSGERSEESRPVIQIEDLDGFFVYFVSLPEVYAGEDPRILRPMLAYQMAKVALMERWGPDLFIPMADNSIYTGVRHSSISVFEAAKMVCSRVWIADLLMEKEEAETLIEIAQYTGTILAHCNNGRFLNNWVDRSMDIAFFRAMRNRHVLPLDDYTSQMWQTFDETMLYKESSLGIQIYWVNKILTGMLHTSLLKNTTAVYEYRNGIGALIERIMTLAPAEINFTEVLLEIKAIERYCSQPN